MAQSALMMPARLLLCATQRHDMSRAMRYAILCRCHAFAYFSLIIYRYAAAA